MITKKRSVSKGAKTYMIRFVGGPLDGRDQYRPLPSTISKKNPRFIDKSYWDVRPQARRDPWTPNSKTNTINTTDKFLRQNHAYYVCKEDDVRKVKRDDVAIYEFRPDYNPDKDAYFVRFPNEKPVF